MRVSCEKNSEKNILDSHGNSIATECVKTVKDQKFIRTAL